MKIFASGSCRLLYSLHDGRGKVHPIHSLYYNFVGSNFLGKLHNTQQHLQFISYLRDDLPDYIKSKFLTSYSTDKFRECTFEDLSMNETKRKNISSEIDQCDWFVIEICSLKLYTKDGYSVQYELTQDYEYREQTNEELLIDLQKIRFLFPGKKMLFQTHFRPNIIYQDPSRVIQKREDIYETVKYFCEQNDHTYHYDPSILLETNHSLFDGDTHFTEQGSVENFNTIYANFFSKY